MRAFATATLMALTTSACAFGRPIELVVPDGFQGEIKLIVDKEKGVTLRPDLFRYVIRFPANGELRIKDHDFLYYYRSYSARYDNGTELQIVTSHMIAGIRSTGPSSQGTDFDGTTHVWVVAPKNAR